MTHLLSDARVVEAVSKELGALLGVSWPIPTTAADVLDAAVVALPRDELIEKAARAIAARVMSLPWDHLFAEDRETYRHDAEAVLVAIGLIPEHVAEGGHD